MVHTVGFTKRSLVEIKEMSKDVTDKLFINFVKPIKNGFTPSDLRGKYKPSWEMKFVNSPMKQAFVKTSKEYNLHHYHFGYQFYKTGNDPKFDGDVSDGIIHTRVNIANKTTSHVILQVCLKHPSPFKYPFERAIDKSIENN